jgi:hypothetical protein
VSCSRGLRILGPMRALISLSGSILVSLPLCLFLKLENFIIYVSLCNSRIHVITLYSGHVCMYYASMLRCWHLVWILVRTDHPCLGVGCHTLATHQACSSGLDSKDLHIANGSISSTPETSCDDLASLSTFHCLIDETNSILS